MLARMQGKRNPYPLLVGCNLYNRYGKQYGGFSKKLKIELSYDPAITTPGHILKGIYSRIQ
jgi:hypothetical protein